VFPDPENLWQGISRITQYRKSNIMAFVDVRADNQVVLWDDYGQRTFEKVILDNKMKILQVCLLSDYLVILQE